MNTQPFNKFVPVSRKEFLDIEATRECGFTLKRVCDTIRTYGQTFSNSEGQKTVSIFEQEIGSNMCLECVVI